MDRIDATLRNFNTYKPLSILDYSDNYDVWAVIPSLNFTCPGIITSLTYGAQQGINDESSITLHILRFNNETQRYNIIVNSITIMAEQTGSQLYQLHLSPPLEFQRGDIISYRSAGRMRFLFENIASWTEYFIDYLHYDNDWYHLYYKNHALISVTTGEIIIYFVKLILYIIVITIRSSRL